MTESSAAAGSEDGGEALRREVEAVVQMARTYKSVHEVMIDLDGALRTTAADRDLSAATCYKKSSFGDDFCGRHPSQEWPCPLAAESSAAAAAVRERREDDAGPAACSCPGYRCYIQAAKDHDCPNLTAPVGGRSQDEQDPT